MARQYRVNSLDLYKKLGVTKIIKPKKISIFDEGIDTFYLTSPKHKRASSTLPQKTRRPSLRTTSPVKFDKQLPRSSISKQSPDVHENRFVAFNNSPTILSNVKRISSPNFALYQGRNKPLMYSNMEDQPEYNPDYSKVWKSTDKGLIPFNKTQGRKEHRRVYTDISRDVNYSGIDKKTQYPLLDKAQPKPVDPILPVFMLINVTRGNSITQKTLEMNCYKTIDFLPLGSTFGKGWHHEPKTFPQPIKGKSPKIVKLLTKTLNSFT